MKSVVTIGTFDGIHLGHRALLDLTTKIAAERAAQSLAYTFGKPPQNYLGRPKPLLMPPGIKLELLKKHMDRVEVADFVAIQPLTPEEFVETILITKLDAEVVIIGEDFCFGKNRQGNVQTLRDLGQNHDLQVEVVDPVSVEGKPVSSTAIREALKVGDVDSANVLLGKPHRIWGRVVEGEKQARELGFPTANLEIDPEVLIPADGIYAVEVVLDGATKPGALYVGKRPTTFESGQIAIEVHVIDEVNLDLYETVVELKLLKYIRNDQAFSSEEELKIQIARDIQSIRSFFLDEC